MNHPKLLVKKYGYNIIHQTWKTRHIPKERQKDVDSVKQHFGSDTYKYILWTDEDNQKFVKTYYPEFLKLYNDKNLLPINRVDIVRLLYLHQYGGIYIDLDYSINENIYDYCSKHLPKWKSHEIFIVESPNLLNEVLQNSLMISKKRKLFFWYNCVLEIEKIVNSIYGKNKLKLHSLYFRIPLIKKYVKILKTVNMTGPNVLDKTYCSMALSSPTSVKNIAKLPCDIFNYKSSHNEDIMVAQHKYSKTWYFTAFLN